MEWEKLLNPVRRKDATREDIPVKSGDGARTETERDYDRILFSTPVRRLADKTQVFPLDPNDSVRTRLTHSHEVSNLARSIGTNLAFNKGLAESVADAKRNIPAMLAAIGLAHDLGNPPFGHKGETAIRDWFVKNKDVLEPLPNNLRQDFLSFEGNAQTFRLLTKLQVLNDNFGLNLTYGTLAALMKYTVTSDSINKKSPYAGHTKNGFFYSEKEIFEEVWDRTGLPSLARHPLAYVMEACDDIAYSVLDAEDAVKKGLTSFADVIAFIRHASEGDRVVAEVCEKAEKHNREYRNVDLSPAELNDISMQMFRVHAISAMIAAVSDTFWANREAILVGEFERDLVRGSRCATLCKALKTFDRRHAYRHRSVLQLELAGYQAIQRVMDHFWKAIAVRNDPDDLGSERSDPFANYVYNKISENYRRIALSPSNTMPLRYREIQLMTDMISGMTDHFVMTLERELREYAN
jgi:dGTPase